MQLTEVLCLLILVVVVTASSQKVDNESKILKPGNDKEARRMTKRDIVVIDNFPFENSKQNPKVIYRRVSRQRYIKPKPKHGLPRPKYGPPKTAKRPFKNRGKRVKSKYGFSTATGKKRSPIHRYGPPKSRRVQDSYAPPKKHRQQSSYVPQEPAGFAEPPPEYVHGHKSPQGYGEPPTDSYGAPLRFTSESDSKPYPLIQDHAHPPIQNHAYPPSGDGQDLNVAHSYQRPVKYQPWEKETNYPFADFGDSAPAHSHKYVSEAKPFSGTSFVDDPSLKDPEDVHAHFYSVHHHGSEHQLRYKKEKKKNIYNNDYSKIKYKSRPVPKTFQKDEILVGGQYAEPPPRYVPKFKVTDPDENFFSSLKGFDDSDVADAEREISPYVNYKHSNIAFSPQNLNDAFSIVD